MAQRILIVDDDVELCWLVRQYLTGEGFEVETVHTGPEGLERAQAGDYALVVLDVMLPGMSGLDVLRNLRRESPMPVLILTARGDDVDRIVGLEIGADDYLPKPFNPRELAARIRAILRRTASGQAGGAEKLAVGDVEMDLGARTVRRAGQSVELTALEFALLERLLRSAGRVVTREQLAEEVLGRKLVAWDRSLDVHVSKLRKKLGEQVNGVDRIKTLRGVGYLYAAPETQERR
jgi:two-component system response regulator CpxR